eukprot:COSAG04_NODE_1485_length_6559_cov_7.307585_2_plen_109_part_00
MQPPPLLCSQALISVGHALSTNSRVNSRGTAMGCRARMEVRRTLRENALRRVSHGSSRAHFSLRAGERRVLLRQEMAPRRRLVKLSAAMYPSAAPQRCRMLMLATRYT